MRILGLFLILWIAAGAARAETLSSDSGSIRVESMLSGLDTPWAIAFLPGGGYLVTEREGVLLHVRDGRAQQVHGVPRVSAVGQGGLLDVMVPRDFAASRAVFLTYSRAEPGGGAGTAVAVGKLAPNGTMLRDVRTIFAAAPGSRGGRHFGSRIVEGADGTLFVTLGERGDRPSAQDRRNHNGSVLRINRDGSVPADNPFVGAPGIQPEIWSYGHRNPQGAVVDGQGRLWVVEHGARGGDEVNRIRRGANYGWPVIAYGRHYSGETIGEGTAKQGMEQPVFYWDPSIAPSDVMIYSGRLWPEWRGDFLVGSLKFGMISRLEGNPLREVERISGAATERVRDVAEAPDGSIWVVSEGQGAIYRLTPAR